MAEPGKKREKHFSLEHVEVVRVQSTLEPSDQSAFEKLLARLLVRAYLRADGPEASEETKKAEECLT